MRSIISFIFFVFSVCLATQLNAQTDNNSKVFKQLYQTIVAQQPEKAYELLNSSFQEKVTKTAFCDFMKLTLLGKGAITDTQLIEQKSNVSRYKLVLQDNSAYTVSISADETGKIAGLRVQPYEAKAAAKNKRSGTNNPLQTELDKGVDAAARNYIDYGNTVGLSVGIIKNGTSNFYGYGTTNKEHEEIPTSASVFEIGSITKTFTALLFQMACEQKKVKAEDPITRYFADVYYTPYLGKITLKMLANHTSGFPRLPDNLVDEEMDAQNPYKHYDSKHLLSYLKSYKTDKTPGTTADYSNLGSGLLGYILSTVYHVDYAQLLTDKIFSPLQMIHTSAGKADTIKNMTKGYASDGTASGYWDLNVLSGAGAIKSNTEDMLKYLGAAIDMPQTAISKSIQACTIPTCNKGMSIGLGWMISGTGDDTYYWHNGGTGGYSSFAAFSPTKKWAIVLLSNSAQQIDGTALDMIKQLNN